MGRKTVINKKTLVSLFIVAIMVLSTFGFILSYSTGQSKKQEYNGHKFKITEAGMQTEVNDHEIYFNFFPTQLEDINVSRELKEFLQKTKALTITYDPNSNMATAMAEAQYQTEKNFPEYTDIYVIRGLTNATGYTTKEFTCENATETNPVLELREGNYTKLTLQDNCIVAFGANENDFYRIYERILYTLLEIME